MTVRPYVLTGATALSQLQQALQALLGHWCAQWGIEPQSVLLDCVRAGDIKDVPATAAWRHGGQQGEAALALAWPGELAQQLERMLFPPDRHYADQAAGASTLAAAGAEQALAELVRALSAACAVAGAAPFDAAARAAQFAPGSGAVVANLRFGKCVCVCLLNDGAVRAALAGRGVAALPLPPLPRLDYAKVLGHVALDLSMSIGSAEVALGSLLGLGIGDVVRLGSSVERPLTVRAPDGTPLFDAHLGTVDDMLAVEIAGRTQ